MFRYIDTIILINTTNSDCTLFLVDFPNNLELTENFLSNNTINFSHLHFKLLDNKTITDLHDKRKDF